MQHAFGEIRVPITLGKSKDKGEQSDYDEIASGTSMFGKTNSGEYEQIEGSNGLTTKLRGLYQDENGRN